MWHTYRVHTFPTDPEKIRVKSLLSQGERLMEKIKHTFVTQFSVSVYLLSTRSRNTKCLSVNNTPIDRIAHKTRLPTGHAQKKTPWSCRRSPDTVETSHQPTFLTYRTRMVETPMMTWSRMWQLPELCGVSFTSQHWCHELSWDEVHHVVVQNREPYDERLTISGNSKSFEGPVLTVGATYIWNLFSLSFIEREQVPFF
jgi:hypothetical protein